MKKSVALPSALLASLILAACGGSGTDDSSSQNATPTSAESFAEPGLNPVIQALPDAEAVDALAASAQSDPLTSPSADSVADTSSNETEPVYAAVAVSSGSTTTTTGTHLYVATTGSDSNPGTQGAPFKTILKASRSAKPGTTVHVAPGTYAGGFQTFTSGTAAARVRYVSDVKWGAKIIPAAGTTKVYAWDERGSYVDIVGFDIDGQSGMAWRNGILTRGSHNIFKDNHVHHIADKVPCESSGGSAIGATHYEYGIQAHVINNVVHHIGYTGCKFIQGIYMSTSGTVKNNLVYAVGKTGIQLWHDATDVIIANNTVFGNDTGIKVGGGDFYHNTINDNTHVTNNIVYDNLIGIMESGATGTNNTYINNLVFKNTTTNFQLKNGNTHVGTVTADPQFVNYRRTGGGDYRLRATSPAIDKGLSTYAPSSDIIRTPRPQYRADDIGAYEYM